VKPDARFVFTFPIGLLFRNVKTKASIATISPEILNDPTQTSRFFLLSSLHEPKPSQTNLGCQGAIAQCTKDAELQLCFTNMLDFGYKSTASSIYSPSSQGQTSTHQCRNLCESGKHIDSAPIAPTAASAFVSTRTRGSQERRHGPDHNPGRDHCRRSQKGKGSTRGLHHTGVDITLAGVGHRMHDV